MIKLVYGDNRPEIEKNVRRELGEGYEVYEGEDLLESNLVDIFRGTTLFEAGTRRILLKNLLENRAFWAKLIDFVDTKHQVIVWEQKIDKRLAETKALAEAGVVMQEYKMPYVPVAGVFDVLEVAYKDGKKAVEIVERVKGQEDPYKFIGLLAKKAMDKYKATGGGAKERWVLKELAKIDLQTKTVALEPWMLIEGFLLRVQGATN